LIVVGLLAKVIQRVSPLLTFVTSPIWLPVFFLYRFSRAIRRPKDSQHQNGQNGKESRGKATFSDRDYKSSQTTEKIKSPTLSPHEVLGVSKNASKAEIVRAFRAKLKLNHPDHLHDLDPELQKYANERTRLIHEAYSALRT